VSYSAPAESYSAPAESYSTSVEPRHSATDLVDFPACLSRDLGRHLVFVQAKDVVSYLPCVKKLHDVWVMLLMQNIPY
jgi:hypothetical protein